MAKEIKITKREINEGIELVYWVDSEQRQYFSGKLFRKDDAYRQLCIMFAQLVLGTLTDDEPSEADSVAGG